jgi:hypothetical protein
MKGYSATIKKSDKEYTFKMLGSKEQVLANLSMEFSKKEVSLATLTPLSSEETQALSQEFDDCWDNY